MHEAFKHWKKQLVRGLQKENVLLNDQETIRHQFIKLNGNNAQKHTRRLGSLFIQKYKSLWK